MTRRGGAPKGNTNAAAHGLYSTRQLTHRVTLPERIETAALAEYAATLADAALGISQALFDQLEATPENHKDQALVGLYASVAEELAQAAAELEGVTGIKPASLGRLTDAQFDVLMRRSSQALGLVLSQCLTAWKRIQDQESIEHNGLIRDGEANPVLKYLAAHMRAAKRMMRDMAADLAWREAGVASEDNLMGRIMAIIEGERA